MPPNGLDPVKGWPTRLISAAAWKLAYNATVTQQAEYFDGQSAARYPVALRFDAGSLRIESDAVNQIWPYDHIRYASEDPADLPLSFRCQSAEIDAARLIVADQAIIDGLKTRCSDLHDRTRQSAARKRGTVWAAAGIVGLGLVIWSSIHFLPRLVAPLIPLAWEEALGDGVVSDIEGIFGAFSDGKAKRCDDPAGRLALDKMTGLLANQIKSPYRFQVVVLDVEMVNALAAPGGRIVIFSELLKEATTPDEVAGVLAHEMGHAIFRHPTESVARSMGISLVFNVLLGGLGSGATGAAGQALVSSAYSRDAEREADPIALDILSGAQISPKGFADFFDRLAKTEGDGAHVLNFISTHPPSDERAQTAKAAMSQNVRAALSDTDWKALKAICGEKPEKKKSRN
jgi:Zn-dependent protease with chaperone function